MTERTCAVCGAQHGDRLRDRCLGEIPGVFAACCGHGRPDRFSRPYCIGDEAGCAEFLRLCPDQPPDDRRVVYESHFRGMRSVEIADGVAGGVGIIVSSHWGARLPTTLRDRIGTATERPEFPPESNTFWLTHPA